MEKSTDSASSSAAAANPAAAPPGSHQASGGSCSMDDASTAQLSPTAPPPSAQQQQSLRDNIGRSSSGSLGCGPAQAAAGVAVAASTAATNSSTAAVSANSGSSTIVAGTPRRFILSAIPPPLGAPALPHFANGAAFALPLPQHTINLNISTTTGGNFGVAVDPQISVENLKRIVAKKLKVAKDRICLLHREKELQDGILKDYNLMDGSKIILIPNVETGLLAQRPENTVMQALESLNDSQVNDFLSGKTPLNLSMRLGDHMMLIQLQLSTVNPANAAGATANGGCSSSSRLRSSSQRSSRAAAAAAVTSATAAAAAGVATPHHNHHSHHHHHHHHHHPSAANLSTSTAAATRKTEAERAIRVPASSASSAVGAGATSSTTAVGTASNASIIKSSELSNFLSKHQYEQQYESLQNIVRSIAMARPTRLQPAATTVAAQMPAQLPQAVIVQTAAATASSQSVRATGFHTSAEAALLEQSPIKSLSNLVSSPIKTAAIKNIPIVNGKSSSSAAAAAASSATSSPTQLTNGVAVPATAAAAAVAAACQDPIAAKLTSCLCTRLNDGGAIDHIAAKSCIEAACLSRQEPVAADYIAQSAALTSTPNNHKTDEAATSTAVASPLHKTANNPITRSKHRHHHHHHHHHHHYHLHSSGNSSSSSSTASASSSAVGPIAVRAKLPVSPRSSSAASNDSGFVSDDAVLASSSSNTGSTVVAPITAAPPATAADANDSGIAVSDTRTLAEASRNLTQTLRKLSKEVFTNKIDLSVGDDTPRKGGGGSGAVIESMKNHGKGIYSGTFSGTLNPALQDRYGRPKRDISTVIHILNDLLSATPQYSRGARISFEAPSTSSAAAANASGASVAHSSKSKQLSSKHQSHAHTCMKCVKAAAAHHSSAAAASGACAYGECNGHYVSKKQACCQDLSSAAAAGKSKSSNSADAASSGERNVCSCRYRIASETGEREREHTCQKCLVAMDNLKTKSKIDQLRLVMQQRKQKREARKLKLTPYGARVVGATSTAAATLTATAASNAGSSTTSAAALSSSASTALSSGPTTPPSEVSANHNIVEEVDTAA